MKTSCVSWMVTVPLAILSCAPRTSIVWIEGEKQPDKHAVHELLICNPPKGTDWDIWGVFDRIWTMPVEVLEGSAWILLASEGRRERYCFAR
ncbi:MAG: hypothetical protein IJQ93_11765 [Bacteroidales bacterium]|nr:hypothetical protein [Bacteroidales bacterium]